MIRIALLAALAALASTTSAAAAPKPGDRTASPQQMLSDMPAPAPDAEIEAIAAAAAVHPLGTPENPVRVGGPEGERAYLARLRCGDGSAPRIGARSSGPAGAYGTIVTLYELDCGAAAPGRAALAFDMYHAEHGETRAPPGFALAPR